MPRKCKSLNERSIDRRGFIIFGKISSPQELRLAGLSSRCDAYYPEYGKWCSPRNTSKAAFYRDLAFRWQRRRIFTSGTYIINVRIPDSVRHRGSLSDVLSCIAAERDQARIKSDRNYHVSSKTFSVLRSSDHTVRGIEDLGDLYAILVGTKLFVYDRRSIGPEQARAIKTLANRLDGSVL